ncbi:NADH-quinone oxidoreductase subunit NuoK [Nocardioides mesophilus]|uniref:NADH-quinone oxidoreductase subunit K n=1 Tax=Nocardioides mesophilus TaxID=433659 RepID=A0A7G9R6U0_9ACTN|nr:NADH-quinone oxidoreductase subunit NuoK [Nocardioides mesophilus]QNN51315.1 NADH-quinone oxidoreductase subunit NuoK [Nocardioides mesophilus]
MPLWWPLLLASLLFAIGVYGVLARRNAVLVLMGVELMLNAVNINLVAFDAHLRDVLHGGQTLALFTIVIAAAEVGLALSVVLLVFRTHGHIELDLLRDLADRDPGARAGHGPADHPSDHLADGPADRGVAR